MIEITRDIQIREEELIFKASRSAGPGGQNVNKLNTRITLFFDVAGCPSLSEQQKRRIFSRLSTRIDKKGLLRVVSQKFRTQKANHHAAVERLRELLAGALKTKPIRKLSEMATNRPFSIPRNGMKINPPVKEPSIAPTVLAA